ncbi:MAG: hypothetical protein QG635_2445, partial [Bacteroidota bacterium]|nr:hypothetical protein [Bacteroidota bacterium]
MKRHNTIFIILIFFLIISNINIVSIFSQKSVSEPKIVNIGFSSNLFPETNFRDAKAAIESWSKELIRNRYLDYKLIAQIYQDNSSIIQALNDNEIRIIS